ncbi:aldehyde ferredoxin oxidoreductase [Dissulfurispira thermophila]|uniref:Aldehyde ferredoxin oxidoreductase n=1 Tax=Dissulfurispira thermophila TaxID=2715679 RepID=A0A7G1GZR9_9BACT|nr:aldehyde ferredoxin oxidoreductase family protein [Dissulfurispira thermophila]BCB95990.1 aldehyde ferredoxin oxidoreductase [Dissulfurispira thermophila]
MTGYAGKSIKVDLTKKEVSIFDTPVELCNEYLGGRGIGVRMISDRITYDYNSHDMPLIFATGPLVGTSAPTSGRMSVISRSPLTGTVFDCSVGGKFGTELKKAGFDFIEIVGISDKWVLLEIDNGNVAIKDSPNLYGKNISDVRSILDGRGSYASIGMAGEKQVRYASIVFDGHYCAGRGGLGAVMGAKKLKAIKVKGDGKIPVADPDGLKLARQEIMRLLRASQAVFGEFGLSEFGTAALVDLIHARRMEPTHNFRETMFSDASKYSGYNMKIYYKAKKAGCAGCPVLCKKIGANGEVIPEFETVSHFGALNGCNDLSAIVEANRICNEYGIDTITAASTIACYSEINERFLSPDEMIRLLVNIGMRDEGIGDMLAEGSLRYATLKGHPELSMSVKGLELPAYDPRGAYGMALAYATSNRGGCHLRAYPISHEILRKPVSTDRFSFEGKARMIKIAEDLNAVIDSLTACKFVFFAASLEEYAKAINAVTGENYDVQSLLKIGENIWNLERHLNELNGFTKSHDDLPERFFREGGTSSRNIRIPPIDREKFLKARENYYRIRGYSK